jgi:hypothetical protein
MVLSSSEFWLGLYWGGVVVSVALMPSLDKFINGEIVHPLSMVGLCTLWPISAPLMGWVAWKEKP